MINLSELASSLAHEASGFEGKWHIIEFQPVLEVPQRFVIGVALSSKGRLCEFRVAEDASRLKCFYGDAYNNSTWKWIRDELLADLQRAKGATLSKYESPSPQIHLSEGQYASGSDALAVLSRTFARVVTVSKAEVKPRSSGVAQQDLRKHMSRLLKLSLGAQFESVHQPEHGIRIQQEDLFYTFDVNYDDAKVASSVVSASYSDLALAQLNIQTSFSDLMMYGKLRQREQLGLAVLVPSTKNFSATVVSAWQKWWDSMSYKLKESDLMLVAESERPEELAEQMTDWYTA